MRGESWTDAKVGFCFFDFSRQLPTKGPEDAVHSRHSCGHEDDDVVGMGLSPGWGTHTHGSCQARALTSQTSPTGRTGFRLKPTGAAGSVR